MDIDLESLVTHEDAFEVFDGLTPEEFGEIVTWTETFTVEEGETVISEGEQAQRLYVLTKGTAKVFKRDDGGSRRELAELEPGAVIGELGLYLDVPRTATVSASSEAEFIALDGKLFHDALEEYHSAVHKIERNLLRMLARRQRELNQELMNDFDGERRLPSEDEVSELRRRLTRNWSF